MFEAAGVSVPQHPAPSLSAVTHTPDASFPTTPIRLSRGPAAELGEEGVRLLLREFIAQHAQLLGVSAPAVSLLRTSPGGAGATRYHFAQTDYPYPILAPFGELELVVTPEGSLVGISDRALPLVSLPATPLVTREAAAAGLVGASLSFDDKTGTARVVSVPDASAVRVARLVVLPELTDQALFVRLAWEIVASGAPEGAGPAWTVYVDAITGERRTVVQNFQT
jgi:hypothetical protein